MQPECNNNTVEELQSEIERLKLRLATTITERHSEKRHSEQALKEAHERIRVLEREKQPDEAVSEAAQKLLQDPVAMEDVCAVGRALWTINQLLTRHDMRAHPLFVQLVDRETELCERFAEHRQRFLDQALCLGTSPLVRVLQRLRAIEKRDDDGAIVVHGVSPGGISQWLAEQPGAPLTQEECYEVLKFMEAWTIKCSAYRFFEVGGERGVRYSKDEKVPVARYSGVLGQMTLHICAAFAKRVCKVALGDVSPVVTNAGESVHK